MDSMDQIHRTRRMLKIITNAILGGGCLAFLLALIYILGALAEQIR